MITIAYTTYVLTVAKTFLFSQLDIVMQHVTNATEWYNQWSLHYAQTNFAFGT